MPDLPFKAGDVCYFVLPVGDAGRAHRFYGHLLGWSFTPGKVEGGSNIDGVSPPGGMHESDDQGGRFGLWAPNAGQP